jgi:hypothetical protein
LEVVAVEMEGVFAGVVIVDDDLDDFALLKDEGVGVCAVDGRVCGKVLGSAKSGVKGWDLLMDVGYVVEESATETRR